MTDEPRCAWACDSSLPLELIYAEIGSRFYTCPCCGKTTRIDYEWVAHRVQKPLPAIDVNGALIDGP